MRNITKLGLAIGFLLGVFYNAGFFIIASTAGGMWIGNSISGLIDGQITTLLGGPGASIKLIEKSQAPFTYWGQVISELLIGCFALLIGCNPPT